MYHFTALVTCLAILFYFFTSIEVSRARVRFGVKAPAISGNPDFERVFRVQMNTLEWMPIFLPSLWLFAIYISDIGAAGLGLIWIAGRIVGGTAAEGGCRRWYSWQLISRGLERPPVSRLSTFFLLRVLTLEHMFGMVSLPPPETSFP